MIDVEKDGAEIGEIVFSGVTPKAEGLIKKIDLHPAGNICCRGYYKDATATEKLFAGGVLHSGDLAVCHPDGAIQILDRAKDIIISGRLSSKPISLLF